MSIHCNFMHLALRSPKKQHMQKIPLLGKTSSTSPTDGQVAGGPQGPRGLITPNASRSEGPHNTQCFKVGGAS